MTGDDCKQCIVSVPTYFNRAQRNSTLKACKMAGFECLRIIEEPSAAALAYAYDSKVFERSKDQRVFIFDFGGGTLDLSILMIQASKIQILATKGDNHLGGQDIDTALVKHLMQHFITTEDIDLSDNDRAKAKLKEKSKQAKEDLSASHSTEIHLESLH